MWAWFPAHRLRVCFDAWASRIKYIKGRMCAHMHTYRKPFEY